MQGYIFLLFSIAFEVFGSAMLKLSAGFTAFIPSLLLVISYGISFVLFVFALKTISLSIGYSIWAGIGTAATGIVGMIFFNEVLSTVNKLGLLIIILGVIIMNLDKKEDGLGDISSRSEERRV